MKNRTVLVADDDADMRELVAEALTEAGWSVLKAADGKAAWEALSSGKAQMAVLDVNMPGMGGLELTRRLRSDKRTSGVPVLLLTVRELVEDQLAGYDRGADDYLLKPFDEEMLIARLRVLERRILEKPARPS